MVLAEDDRKNLRTFREFENQRVDATIGTETIPCSLSMFMSQPNKILRTVSINFSNMPEMPLIIENVRDVLYEGKKLTQFVMEELMEDEEYWTDEVYCIGLQIKATRFGEVDERLRPRNVERTHGS